MRIYLHVGRVSRASRPRHKAEPREGAQVAAPSRRRLHPDDPSPGSEARSASRCRRRACCYPPSGLGCVSKSSSRARRSVPHPRPAVRLLKRAVDAVKRRRCGSKDRDPAARAWPIGAHSSFTSSDVHSTPPPSQTPTTGQQSPPQRQLSAGEGSSRPPATIYRISLTNGAGRVLLRRDVARGLRVEGVCYGSAERPLWLLACAVAIRCCLK